jgi:hypothetical protein
MGDLVVEGSGAGTDTVQAGVTWTIANTANVENLTLTGSSAINATGNALDNVLTGNSAANVLTGDAGNDTYAGGAGNDTLNDTSTTSNDVYRWGVGQGNDAISDAGGSADRIEIAAGVTASQISLTRATNDLQVRISGATDVLTVKNWYVGIANRIEEIRLADGTIINTGTAAPASLASGTAAALMWSASRGGLRGHERRPWRPSVGAGPVGVRPCRRVGRPGASPGAHPAAGGSVHWVLRHWHGRCPRSTQIVRTRVKARESAVLWPAFLRQAGPSSAVA